jgi:NO-binding membrane sensor protein with MHYT domain
MHFIGNRAVILSHGETHAQIVYSSGFTAISFFLPIIVLLGAFYVIGTSESATTLRLLFGGALTALAVCGMHYVGQLGIANYTCTYDWPHVLGAAIIAVFASLIALSAFFRMRAWTNLWWKRALCASILASAMSGMHWLATVGTLYRYKGLSPSAQSELSRQQTVIIVLVLVSQPPACALLS